MFLAESKRINPNVLTKTSLILGLGETDEEIEQTMDDLIENKVDILTIGQYSKTNFKSPSYRKMGNSRRV
jgi:lipoate synthase